MQTFKINEFRLAQFYLFKIKFNLLLNNKIGKIINKKDCHNQLCLSYIPLLKYDIGSSLLKSIMT